MARGKNAELGAERVSQNGYTYIKTEDGWMLKHHVIAEKKLGRKIRADERVRFVDGKKSNLDPKNVEIVTRASGSLRRRKAALEVRIEELQAELREVNHSLQNPIIDHNKEA